MTYVGLDRARGRWAAVALSGRAVEAEILASAAEVMGRWPDAAVVGVDVPIGLPEGGIGRPVDTEARRLLGRQGSSVFPALPEGLYRLPYSDALDEARRRFGQGFSKQAWNLGPAVLDVAAATGPRWFEVHPELAFARLADGSLPSKRTESGRRARIDLLVSVGVAVPTDPFGPLAGDVVDAAVCAYVASLIGAETASVIGDPRAGRIWF